MTGGPTRILIIDDTPGPDADAAEPLSGEWPIAALAGAESLPPVVETRPDSPVVRELVARIEALVHRAGPGSPPSGSPPSGSPPPGRWPHPVRCGPVELDPTAGTVLRDGAPVKVTGTEFRLLLALMRRRGAIASRGELLREIWGAGAAVGRRVVDTHVARLRRKLEDDPAHPRHIVTALAWGYRFRP